MKKTLVTLTLALLTVPAFTAEPNANANEPPPIITERSNIGVDFKTFGILETSDFDDDERTGTGVGLNYWFLDNVGLGTEAIVYDTEGSFVDRVNGLMLFRAPINERVALVPFGGIGRSIEDDIWGFQLGMRLQAKVYGPLLLDIGARWISDDGQDSRAGFDAGLGFSF